VSLRYVDNDDVRVRGLARNAELLDLQTSSARVRCSGGLQDDVPSPPGFHASAHTVFHILMGFEVLGVLVRWSIFDHWAHLGGALFGYLYAMYGKKAIWDQRDRILDALRIAKS
jgi:membrane associated rhomboid family serine protease